MGEEKERTKLSHRTEGKKFAPPFVAPKSDEEGKEKKTFKEDYLSAEPARGKKEGTRPVQGRATIFLR